MARTKVQLISDGAIIGIQSAGVTTGIGATTLNFIGAGNTFAYNAGTKTLDISISSGSASVMVIPTRSGTAVTFTIPTTRILGVVARSGTINVPV